MAALLNVDGSLHFLGRRLIKLVNLILLQHEKLGIKPRSGKWMQNPSHTRDHLICPHIPFFRPAEEITLQGLPLKHGQLRPIQGAHVNHNPFDILSLKIGIQEIVYFLVISVNSADPLALPQRVCLQKVVVRFIDIPLLFDSPSVVIPGQEILDLRVAGKFIENQLLSQAAIHITAEPFPQISHPVCPFRFHQLWSPRYSFGLMPQCFLNTLIKLEASAYPVISAIS